MLELIAFLMVFAFVVAGAAYLRRKRAKDDAPTGYSEPRTRNDLDLP